MNMTNNDIAGKLQNTDSSAKFFQLFQVVDSSSRTALIDLCSFNNSLYKEKKPRFQVKIFISFQTVSEVSQN